MEPMGGDAALAALLRFITAAFVESAEDPTHPKAMLGRLAPQLPPFFRVWLGAGDKAGVAACWSFSGRHSVHTSVFAACSCGLFSQRERSWDESMAGTKGSESLTELVLE